MVGAIIGIASTVATTAMSFAQANKQKKLQKQAEQEADKAMFAARKRLEVNYMDALSVQKEPYELARQAMLAQGTQATQAGQESERGAAATAGRVQMGQNEAQGDIRTAMGKELTEIERLKVAEDARLRDLNVQLDLGEIEGAQMAAANAQEMSAAAMEQGFAGVTSAATQGANLIPLYGKTKQQAVPVTNTNTGGSGVVDTRNAVLNPSGVQLTSAGSNMQYNPFGTGMPTLNQNQQYPFMVGGLQSSPVNPFYPQIQLPIQ
jgi:hypothetical protein